MPHGLAEACFAKVPLAHSVWPGYAFDGLDAVRDARVRVVRPQPLLVGQCNRREPIHDLTRSDPMLERERVGARGELIVSGTQCRGVSG